MKALYFNLHGSIDKLEYGELPIPSLKPDEVLVRIHACALNHLDLWVLKGWKGLNLNLPHIGGSDISGKIFEVGKNVSHWKTADEVIIRPGFSLIEDEFSKRGDESLSPNYQIIGESRPGGLAEYIAVPAEVLHKKPSNFSFEEACAPLLVGLTAYRMLVHKAGLNAGDWVLIVGAGGGLNSFSIQLAKALGAKVIALSSSEKKCTRALEIGADEVVNYQEYPSWSKRVKEISSGGVQIVVDNVGLTFNESLRSLALGGTLVTVGNTAGVEVTFDNRLIFGKQLKILGSTMGSKADFAALLNLLESAKVKPIIDRALPLAQGKAAYQLLENGDQFGKIILCPSLIN